MNFELYKNTLSYPNKKDFTTCFWYKKGKVVAKQVNDGPMEEVSLSLADLNNCIHEKVVDEVAYKAALNKYHAEDARIEEQFRQDFFNELGIADHPKRDKLYQKAYERGHSAGYQEVFLCGEDLVDLIKD